MSTNRLSAADLSRRVVLVPLSIDLSTKYRCLRPRNRFTNVTDTVLGIGVETASAAEEAIEKGRSVEFYVTDDEKRGMLGTRILDSFRTAHSRGMFQVLAVVFAGHATPTCPWF